MSEKSMPERMGVVETKLEDHGKRVENLEKENEDRQNNIAKAMWWTIKLLGLVTFLTLVTEKSKERWEVLRGVLGL